MHVGTNHKCLYMRSTRMTRRNATMESASVSANWGHIITNVIAERKPKTGHCLPL